MTEINFALSASLTAESAVLDDGSIWSHAATIGPCWYGTRKLELTADLFRNFVRVFSSALPKVPVDYDHGQTNGAADGSRPVPVAGQVLELAVVEKVAELTAPMRAQLAKSGRTADHASALGLWIRWRPTPAALRMVQNREYTELSIAFGRFENPRTGASEGEALVAVALCNRPQLTDMVSVAASRSGGGPPSGTGRQETNMNRVLNALSALRGNAIETDDQAVVELAAAKTQIAQLSAKSGHLDAITAEIGETDPVKAIAKVREFKASAVTALSQAETAKKAEVTTKVAAELKRLEKKYLPAQKDLLSARLTAEFTAGAVSDTVKLLEGMPDLNITGRASGADDGSADLAGSIDKQIDIKAKTLMREDPELVELAKTNRGEALKAAILRAGKELNYAGSAAR